MCAISCRVPVAYESRTSSEVTSMMTPSARKRPTCSTSASRSWMISASVSADWMVAMRYGPCLRIGTCMDIPPAGAEARRPVSDRLSIGGRDHLVAEQTLRLLDTPLQVADRVHLPEIHAHVHPGLGGLRRQSGD